MTFLNQLKQRKVFRAAALYIVVSWGILQVIDVVNAPLNLPAWFATVTFLLLALGFPIALIFSWIFDFGREGLTKSTIESQSTLSTRGWVEICLLLVLIAGIGWLIARDVSKSETNIDAKVGPPTVIVMDTYAPQGVYDEETRKKSGTNADVLSDILQDLPVVIQKETIGSTWDRESQILSQKPALILIHRSAFFHSMNQELGMGYPAEGQAYSDAFVRLYQIADNKLVAFLGFIAGGNANTQFIVYSRGTGGGWTEEAYRTNWVKQAQGRFPSLEGNITTVAIPGGVAGGSLRNPETSAIIRNLVVDRLALRLPQQSLHPPQ